MGDGLLALTDKEEAISIAYVQAIAAGAGYVIAKMDFDRDGVDVQIRAGGEMRPCLDVQLKSTINLGDPVDDQFRYPLKRRNYDLLRAPSMVPRVLVVLALPTQPKDWITVSSEQLVMRRCAYWTALGSLPDTDNKESVTISIPNKNLFDVECLKGLMNRSRMGAIA